MRLTAHFTAILCVVMVSISEAGTLLVGNGLSTPGNVLQVNSTAMSLSGIFGQANNFSPSPGAMARDSLNRVYVLDTNPDQIQRFSPTGTFIGIFASSGFGVNGSYYGMAIDASDNVYVASTGSMPFDQSDDAIVRYDKNGNFLGTFGQASFVSSGFVAGGPIAFDDQGNLFAATRNGSERIITRYAPDGTLLGTFGQATTAASGLSFISAMVLDESGNLFVRDLRRIVMFDAAGNFVRNIGSFSSDGGLTYDGSGHLYTTNRMAPSSLLEYDVSGTLLASLTDPTLENPSNLLFLAPAPEPGTLALSVFGLPMLLRRRR